MQHAAQQLGVPFARPLNVADMQYAYDIEARSGLAIPTIHIAKINNVSLRANKAMGDTSVCPCTTGACVKTATGGVIEGWDMYGQYVMETVAPAGTSKIAFAGVTVAPLDAEWTERFGLPYKWAAVATGQDAQITATPPAADGDARGTFVYAGTKKAVELRYMVDRTEPFGAPYAKRFASKPRIAPVTFVGTINATGAIVVTKTLIADGSRNVFLTMPDGQTIRSPNAAGPVNYQLPKLWMSKYAGTITDVDKLIRGGTENGTRIRVDLTGSVAVVIEDPAPPPPPPPPELPDAFTTHAQANEWLDAFTASLGIGEPLDWASMTLAQKHAAAKALVDALGD